MSEPQTRLIRFQIESPSGERFEVEVPPDSLLKDIVADFLKAMHLPHKDERYVVVDLVHPENPGEVRRLDGRLTVGEAGILDGSTLRISFESVIHTHPYLFPAARPPSARPKFSRYTDVSFPSRLRAGQVANLRIRIVAGGPHHEHDVPLRLDGPGSVTVSVAAENFTIQGQPFAEITVPPEGDSSPVIFRLRGDRVGPGRVMIDFEQGGRPLGSVDLSPEIVADDQPEAPAPESATNRLDLRASNAPAPEVVLTIHEERYQAGRLRFSLLSRSPLLRDLPFVAQGDLGTIDLHQSVIDWLTKQLGELNGPYPADPREDVRRLVEVGKKLFKILLPEKLQELCWTLAERGVKSMMIYSDDPHIPWELIKPWRRAPATKAVEELPFWGESYNMGRWLRGPGTVDTFALNRVCAVVTTGTAPTRDISVRPTKGAPRKAFPSLQRGPLENAQREKAVISSLEGSGADVCFVPPQRRTFREALTGGDFDVFHLASHACFGGATTADDSAVLMDDGPFTTAELPADVADLLRSRAPLFVFNACSTGRLGYSLTRVGSWAAELIYMGCGGFVGTLWRVTDDGALAFAEAFYKFLVAGQPVGEATLRARAVLRSRFPDDPTWLAYSCFADPMARVACGGEGPGLAPAHR